MRKKRQHRDALLKLQAVNAQKRTRDDDDGEQEETSETITSDIGPQSSGTMLPTVIDQFNLPDELPLEYLQDDSPTAAALDTARPIKKHKIAHRVGSLASQSRDYRVGNITYRPSAVSQSLLLAPQVNRDVFRSKESWLQRRPGNVLKQGRQPCRKGFFTKQ